MSLDRGVACSGAEEAAGEDVAACTSDGVCASPSGALGEGKETWGLADCVIAGEMVAPSTGGCRRV